MPAGSPVAPNSERESARAPATERRVALRSAVGRTREAAEIAEFCWLLKWATKTSTRGGADDMGETLRGRPFEEQKKMLVSSGGSGTCVGC